MLILLCLSLMADLDVTVLEETEIFAPLEKGDVAVADDGTVYVLNNADARILRYSPDGEQMDAVAEKGEGPGELQFPSRLFFRNQRLYVLDLNNSTISVFKDNTFEDRINLPARGLKVVPTAHGWAYGNWGTIHPVGTEMYLKMADWKFENIKTALTWENKDPTGGVTVNGDTGSYRPVRDRPYMAVSLDGEKVYLTQPQNFRVNVFHAADGKQLKPFSASVKPALFNKEWGEKKVKDVQDAIEQRGINVNLKADLPEYFPVVRNFWVNHKDQLVFHKWTFWPDKKDDYFAIAANGQSAPLSHPGQTDERILIVVGDTAYISHYDVDLDEASIIVCDVKEIEAVTAQFKLEFEGLRDRILVQ